MVVCSGQRLISAGCLALRQLSSEVTMQDVTSPQGASAPTSKRWVRAKDIATMLGTSEQTIWRWAREKSMPAPIKLSPRMTRWELPAIECWLEQKGASA